MTEQHLRTALLLGDDAIKKLACSRVAVFGIGGVGGYAAEALARCGVGTLDLIDSDTISESNINRQIYALKSTVGKYKTDVAAERIANINPEIQVNAHKIFYMPDTSDKFDFTLYDYIIDAIDTVTGKIELVINAELCGTPIISSMGTGNKLDPTAFEVTDIYKTSMCPLARVMRKELSARGIKKLKVVYSKEKPIPPKTVISEGARKAIPGSVSFIPSVAGLIIAGEVIKDLIK